MSPNREYMVSSFLVAALTVVMVVLVVGPAVTHLFQHLAATFAAIP